MSAPEGIDRTRLEHAIEELGRIGETPRGGLTRLALTDEDKRGRDLMVRWMREAGLRVSVDQMGNILGERAGSEPLPPAHWSGTPTRDRAARRMACPSASRTSSSASRWRGSRSTACRTTRG